MRWGDSPGATLPGPPSSSRWARDQLKIEVPHNEDPGFSLPQRSRQYCCYLGAELEASRLDEPGAIDAERRFECRHPEHDSTTLEACHWCRDWSDSPRPAPRPLAQLLPPPGRRCASRVRTWAVGVTTAPRQPATLEWSLDSLIRAGWTEPWLFQDAPVPIARRFAHLPTTVRTWPVGAWPNFYLALIELLMREPDADAYLVVEDDVLYYDRQNLREYLEGSLWPGASPGLVSLYCPARYTRQGAGWHCREAMWTTGALAFVFPAALARRFVTDAQVFEHRWKGPAGGLAGVSVAIGSWAFRTGVPIHYPSPSLAQHIGDRSTVWPANRAEGNRRADRFLGDLDRH